METRVKLFKQYRTQIKKEASINEKLKSQNEDIKQTRKKVSKICDIESSPENDAVFSDIYFIQPKLKDTIKKMQTFIKELNVKKLDEEFKEIVQKNKYADEIIDKKGKINPTYFSNDEVFIKINDIDEEIKVFDANIDEYNILMKDNTNKENDIFYEIKSNPDPYELLKMKKKEYIKITGWKHSKLLFYSLIVLVVISFIVLIILLFI